MDVAMDVVGQVLIRVGQHVDERHVDHYPRPKRIKVPNDDVRAAPGNPASKAIAMKSARTNELRLLGKAYTLYAMAA